jgi:dienelactone hydrolase
MHEDSFRITTAEEFLQRLAGEEIARRFVGNTSEEFAAWREEFRRWLIGLFTRHGVSEDAPPAPPFKVFEETEWHGCRRVELRFVNPSCDTVVPATILLPSKSDKNGAAILCQHGHGDWGRLSVIGDRSRPEIAQEIERYKYDYGLSLALAGYTVIAIDVMGFGQRSLPRRDGRDRCDMMALVLLQSGRALLPMHVSDIRLALSLLASWPGVYAESLGMAGLSLGGRLTMFAAALDERIKVAVSSGACNTYVDRIPAWGGCGTQTLPGMLPGADTPEVFASIAPRPLQVQWGSEDELIVKEPAEAGIAHIQECYRVAGVPERFHADLFGGEHVFDIQPAVEWFGRWL